MAFTNSYFSCYLIKKICKIRIIELTTAKTHVKNILRKIRQIQDKENLLINYFKDDYPEENEKKLNKFIH